MNFHLISIVYALSVLNTCPPKVYTNIGSMYFDFQMHEKVLDLMIDLLQKDQLEDNKKNFDLAEKVCINLQVSLTKQ